MPPVRLSGQDAAFLYLEKPNMHMHVAGLSVLDPSTRPDGRVRAEDLAAVITSRLHLVPRFRQKVVFTPGALARPLWVDDEDFDIDFHLRRAGPRSPRPAAGASSRTTSSAFTPVRSTARSRCGRATSSKGSKTGWWRSSPRSTTR